MPRCINLFKKGNIIYTDKMSVKGIGTSLLNFDKGVIERKCGSGTEYDVMLPQFDGFYRMIGSSFESITIDYDALVVGDRTVCQVLFLKEQDVFRIVDNYEYPQNIFADLATMELKRQCGNRWTFGGKDINGVQIDKYNDLAPYAVYIGKEDIFHIDLVKENFAVIYKNRETKELSLFHKNWEAVIL